MKTTTYVLYTSNGQYVVDYLFRKLLLSDSITEALIFNDKAKAIEFKHVLFKDCKLNCSVNTYIDG